MARELKSVDVSDSPDLLRLAEEVGKTGEARVLRKGRRELAAIVPISARQKSPKKPRKLTQAQREAFLSAAGSWNDVDTDKLLEEIYAARDLDRPPVDL